MLIQDVDTVLTLLRQDNYIADRSLATGIFLALCLGRPLLLEGEAGVGKTEVAKVLSHTLNRRLIRLQCYEGLDIASAAYEWNHARQMIEIRLAEATGMTDRDRLTQDLFSERFLIRRPLLQALESDSENACVLLIDELDRADEPFEAYLLEILSDFQVTIPELGTILAQTPPLIIITSNRTREIHDALRRRCFYVWIDYPSAERETHILSLKVPRASAHLSAQVVGFIQRLRDMDLFKPPGIAETLDWAHTLIALDHTELTTDGITTTLGAILKYQDDLLKIKGSEAARLLKQINEAIASSERCDLNLSADHKQFSSHQ